MKVIFLDIDGVLVNDRSWNLPRRDHHLPADERCVKALNRVVASTGAVIVVTSTWRIDRELPEIREIVNGQFGVMGQVVDKTPFLTREVFRGKRIQVAAERGEEIAAWLQGRDDVQSFVILDDENDMGELLGRTVVTNFRAGLTEADADRALEILGHSAKGR